MIKGTRIPVSGILDQIAQDESWDDLLKSYPELENEDIRPIENMRLVYLPASEHAFRC